MKERVQLKYISKHDTENTIWCEIVAITTRFVIVKINRSNELCIEKENIINKEILEL